ncbi:TetR family transcriptional regulator (plasmid) [Rhizobium sp. CB3090]|uniref:TetR family transcriptional regulator n=1 Tax=Rhizobium sp. CB3090 TaxID=3039156 RepID=UPI0024B03E74|nr:TetR family transcriptional regulator [Rhizobium sp. CB3090]WFU11773.1 TetR family transcriptional regulator [Rhizobium sp. CB3090]
MKKRIRNPEQTKSRIIEFAIEEFTERGLDGARIDAIAEQSQTNKSLIYKYFNSKEDLYIASLASTYEKMRASQHEIDLNDPDPVVCMRQLVERTFDTFANNPRIVRMLTHENVLNARFLKETLSVKLLYTPLLEKLEKVISDGQDKGVFRPGIDLKHLYISISALGYFYFSNMHTLGIVLEKNLAEADAIASQKQMAVDMTLAYLRNPPASI